MNFYQEVLKAERQRLSGYGLEDLDGDEFECPVCGSLDWDFLLKDCHGDIIGCQECVTKVYPDENYVTE